MSPVAESHGSVHLPGPPVASRDSWQGPAAARLPARLREAARSWAISWNLDQRALDALAAALRARELGFEARDTALLLLTICSDRLRACSALRRRRIHARAASRYPSAAL